MRVLEFLNTHAPTLRLESTLQDAVDKLDLYQVTVLPVLDEAGRVRGLITERQLFERLFAPYREGRAPALDALRAATQAQAQTAITLWMMPNPPTLDESAPIEEAVTLMQAHGLDTLPVVGEGRFVGTIRMVDCCQALLETNL